MDAYTDRLSDYLDDEDLEAGARAAIEAHLEACSACRQVLAELQEVAARARTLPPHPPAADLWPGVASRIQPRGWAIGLFRAFGRSGTPSGGTDEQRGTARNAGRRRGSPKRVSFTIPQLVAASVALMALSGALVWLSRPDAPVTSHDQRATVERPAEVSPVLANFAEAQYDQAVADLERALAAGRHSLDPQTVRVLEENLQAIDRAIEQSRAALRGDPANLFLNTHLAATRKRKLDLLRSATALTAKS